MSAPAASRTRRRRVGRWAVPAVVVAHAALQALLVAGDPVPTTAPAFLGRLVVSVLAVAVAGWLLSWRARAAPGAGTWPGARGLGGWVLAVVLVAAAAVVHPLLGALAVVVALPLLVGAGGALRRRPGRAVAVVLLTVVALVLTWAVSLLLGLFVTGVLGALATWLWAGVVAALLLRLWGSFAPR